ncbi:MAG: AbrB/MazE/SpoVT family DNA-binding domain-containing protein [Burkholderiales bacterium]|nr:AbrB/MazE/SpoVT family DNA-binding domain-containing protein [Burkholderiales bacterium]MBK8666358.1 AbrB/MazE/SpoVT family DNA-binding domain-containing protein [Burkholderiales bacterium]
MRLNIQKWGNSAAVRLPSVMLAQMGARIGDAFEVDVANGQATIRLARPKYKLADLLAEMPDGLPRVEGWDALPDVGQEQC